ncbi:MAG TPA: ABC transporter permease [Thermoanaerobaculia bacterium]|nr:ABC transporter permease [Thermoanaerobaculia bacterium]
MRRLLALTWKEFLQLKRDRMTLRMIVMVPVMQTLIFGYAINYDVKHLKTVVLDESRSYESRELVAKMTGTGYFDVVGHVDSMDEMQAQIDSGKASVGVVFDRDFGKNRHRGRPAEAFLIVNASDTTTSSQAMSIMAGIAQTMSIQTLVRRSGWTHKQLPVDVRVRPWYNPDLRTSRFIIPGLIAIILTFTLIQFTAIAIVRERERGTLEQLQVTPATRAELILGKILPYIVIGYFQFTLTLLLMRYLFNIPIAGSVVQLYLVGFLFMAAVLGLGMLISTIAQTQMQATQMSMFFLLPFVFLSGYVFPIEGMPLIFRWISNVIPAKYFISVIRGIVLRGASLAELWEPTALLALYTFLIIALAVMRFKKTTA